MSTENMVEEIKEVHQLYDKGFYTIGELKSAVCSAYEEFGDAEFYYDTPVVFAGACIRTLREKTVEEIEEERRKENRRKDTLHRDWVAKGKKNGWKYE